MFMLIMILFYSSSFAYRLCVKLEDPDNTAIITANMCINLDPALGYKCKIGTNSWRGSVVITTISPKGCIDISNLRQHSDDNIYVWFSVEGSYHSVAGFSNCHKTFTGIFPSEIVATVKVNNHTLTDCNVTE